MNPDILFCTDVLNSICDDCDAPRDTETSCEECIYQQMKYSIKALENQLANSGAQVVDDSCRTCHDKKGENVEVFFFDNANNYISAKYCPSCGRKIYR